MPQEKSAGAIIYRMVNGVPHYLLLHYPSGHWEFARGHGDEGEKEEQTVKREIIEETGIKDFKIIPGFKAHSKFFFKRTYGLQGEAKKKAPWILKIVTLYLAETQVEHVKISHEHTGFLWLPYEQAYKKLLKDAKKVLEKANNFLISRKSV